MDVTRHINGDLTFQIQRKDGSSCQRNYTIWSNLQGMNHTSIIDASVLAQLVVASNGTVDDSTSSVTWTDRIATFGGGYTPTSGSFCFAKAGAVASGNIIFPNGAGLDSSISGASYHVTPFGIKIVGIGISTSSGYDGVTTGVTLSLSLIHI